MLEQSERLFRLVELGRIDIHEYQQSMGAVKGFVFVSSCVSSCGCSHIFALTVAEAVEYGVTRSCKRKASFQNAFVCDGSR